MSVSTVEYFRTDHPSIHDCFEPLRFIRFLAWTLQYFLPNTSVIETNTQKTEEYHKNMKIKKFFFLSIESLEIMCTCVKNWEHLVVKPRRFDS